MGRIGASASLPYPPDRVWRVAARVESLPAWMPEVAGAELLDPPLAVGSRVRLRLSPAAGGATVNASVKELVPAQRLVVTGTGGPLGVTVAVSLRRTPADGTEAAVEVELVTPSFLGFVGDEVERRLRTGLPAALARLQALIEAEPGEPGEPGRTGQPGGPG